MSKASKAKRSAAAKASWAKRKALAQEQNTANINTGGLHSLGVSAANAERQDPNPRPVKRLPFELREMLGSLRIMADSLYGLTTSHVIAMRMLERDYDQR